jgi:polyribonucleotide nucleotidyltransferase
MRTQTTRLLDMMADGVISAQAVAEMALGYMSEDDVADMMQCNDILEDEDLDEDDGQPDEAQEWESFDADC